MPVIKNSYPLLAPNGAVAAGRVVRAYRRDTGALIGEGTSSEGAASPTVLTSFLSMNGVPGVNAVVDAAGMAWTFVGAGVVLSADVPTYGGACLKCTAVSGSHLLGPGVADWAYTSGDFSFRIRAFARVTPGAAGAGLFGNWSANTGFACRVLASGAIEYKSAAVVSTTAAGVFPIGQWNWVHIKRVGGSLEIRVNGTLVLTAAHAGSAATSAQCRIGGTGAGVAAELWDGWLSHFAYSKGGVFAEATLPSGPSTPGLLPGYYDIHTPYSGDVAVMVMDDAAGDIYEDLMLRTTI